MLPHIPSTFTPRACWSCFTWLVVRLPLLYPPPAGVLLTACCVVWGTVPPPVSPSTRATCCWAACLEIPAAARVSSSGIKPCPIRLSACL